MLELNIISYLLRMTSSDYILIPLCFAIVAIWTVYTAFKNRKPGPIQREVEPTPKRIKKNYAMPEDEFNTMFKKAFKNGVENYKILKK